MFRKLILIIVGIYFVGMNVFSYMEMRNDKQLAIDRKYRTSEQELFFYAAIGGAIGTEIAMYDLPSGKSKHKVSKASWRIGTLSLILNHIFILGFVIRKLRKKKEEFEF